MIVGQLLRGSRLEDQIELEIEAITRGVARYRKLANEAVERGDGASLKPIERLLLYWLEPLKFAIKGECDQIKKGASGPGRAIAGPIFMMLDREKMAVVALHATLGACTREPNGMLFPKISYEVGNAVVAEIQADMLRSDHPDIWKELDSRYKRMTVGKINRQAKHTLTDPVWNRKVCVALGSRLLQLLIGVAQIEYEKEDVPAFVHERVWIDKLKRGIIRLSDKAFDLIEDGHLFREHLRPRFMPMLVPPYKWEPGSDVEGGYVKVRTPFVAKPTKSHLSVLKNHKGLSTLYDGLNVVNKTAWAVQPRVLHVMEELWKEGGGACGLPRADAIDLPPKPGNIATDPDALKAWKREAHEVHGQNARNRGARIEFIQKTSLAHRMVNEERFYLPHQFDFRLSRVYPIPLYLNHHGDDVSRGLLSFANGVETKARGYREIQISVANHYGFDKADFDGRVGFVEDMMPQLEAVNKDPMATMSFWQQADDPWQFLHAVFALFDPQIAAHFPCKADGSSNGIQNFAAAGRDERAARAVNLMPSATPQDIYMEVLEVVAPIVEEAAREGHPAAKIVFPLLRRELVKQPVMTTPYNVTRVGARDQVKDKLKKLGVKREDLYPAAQFLANAIMDSVGEVVASSVEIMKWIESCCRMMVDHDPMRAVSWTTPLGAPVIQPYRDMRLIRVKTALQWVSLGVRGDETVPVSKSKQIQGGPPNVVHSWDGSHMLLTAIGCDDEGIDFAAVHDAYWTHGQSMKQMSRINREQFVMMHEADLITGLAEEWSGNYPGVDLPEPPPKGNFDLSQIMESEYFFA